VVRVKSPFEDPEFAARLAEAGVVHRPGTADRLMRDIAPLLAAEGIDLHNLGEGTDLREVNEALARATELHNMMLFTPVGAQRSGALAVLRAVAEALAGGDEDGAAALLAAVESEPTGTEPAISHVIGVSLGLLDAWHTDPALHDPLRATRVPRWNRAARAAATDVLALARKGRAFASLASLHRHGGLALFEGSALAVAASLSARAASENAPVRALAERVLVDGSASGLRPSTRPSDGSRDHTRGGSASADRALQRDFGLWLERAPSIAAPTVAEELAMMQELADLGRMHGLDLHRASHLEPLIDLLWDTDEPEALVGVLETLDDYVHFRLDAGRSLRAWEDAHEAVEEALEECGDLRGPFNAVLERADQVDPEVRRSALSTTPLVTAVGGLLEWIAAGRPVTQTGGVRRADIKDVARMLGVRAVGVAKRVGQGYGGDGPIQARSMADVPLLAHWWEALAAAGVIRTNSSSVRPGAAAPAWTALGQPPLELAETVAAIFVAEALMAPVRQGAIGSLVVRTSVVQLMRALAPEDLGLEFHEVAPFGQEPVWTLRTLESAGLISVASAGMVEVPEGLRAAVARGLLLATTLLGAPEERGRS
jgi:hypothetical protein